MNIGMDQEPIWLATASAVIRELYAYWRARCRDGRPPRRADIDPIEIPKLLPYLTIVEVVPDARRYVYRLVGTREVEVRGNDPTGKSVAEAFYGPSVADGHKFYDRVTATMAPAYDDSPYISQDGRYNDEEMMFLPLSEDGVAVSRILVICRTSLTEEFS